MRVDYRCGYASVTNVSCRTFCFDIYICTQSRCYSVFADDGLRDLRRYRETGDRTSIHLLTRGGVVGVCLHSKLVILVVSQTINFVEVLDSTVFTLSRNERQVSSFDYPGDTVGYIVDGNELAFLIRAVGILIDIVPFKYIVIIRHVRRQQRVNDIVAVQVVVVCWVVTPFDKHRAVVNRG